MNVIDSEIADAIKVCIQRGLGLRATARVACITNNTASRYIFKFKEEGITKIENPPPLPEITKNSSYGAKSVRINKIMPNRYCKCGCGKISSGIYLMGHNPELIRNAAQAQIKKEREKVRKELIEEYHRDRFQDRDDLFKKFKGKGFNNVSLGIILKDGLKDESYKLNKDDLSVPKRKYIIKEREGELILRHIPYERETEIKFLTNRGNFISLDDTLSGDTQMHEIVSPENNYSGMSPLDILMEKEERETKEYQSIRYERHKFSEYIEKNKGLVSIADFDIKLK